MKKIKKVLFLLCCTALPLLLTLSAFAEGYGWYCKRNHEHKQPSIDPNYSFVEQYGGYYIDKKHGDNSEDKVIYLTFDAGYENGNVEKILDALKAENVKACFFILPHLIDANPDLVLRMVNEGHTVGNHSTHHPDMTTLQSKEDFSKELGTLCQKFRALTGREMDPYFRPPEGRFSEKTMQYVYELGYKTIFWSFAYADWDNQKQMASNAAMEKIMSNIHNGAVLLLHPTSKTNAEILPDVIQKLKEMGYRFGTMDELTA